jgi:3-keto-5-aminohexanoate cleavage enzyme
VPELEIFDLGMAEYAHFLIKRGMLVPPFYANILLGSLGTLGATTENLCAVIRALPEGTTWSATGIGRYQFFINSLAVTMGGHVRVGLEDALYYDWDTKRLATNAGMIDRVVRLSRAAGREIATADQARRIIGMPAASTETVSRAA